MSTGRNPVEVPAEAVRDRREPRPSTAIANLRRICEQELEGQYELEIIDVLEHPQLAEDERILATPTLIKQLPPPLRRVIGDLSDTEKVLLGLEVQPDARVRRTRRGRRMTEPRERLRRSRSSPTGIASFDIIAKGGLPQNRTTLDLRHRRAAARRSSPCSSSPRASQRGEPGVFVTFEESAARHPPEHARASAGTSRSGSAKASWAFVDASPDPDDRDRREPAASTSARCSRASSTRSRKVGAERVAVDSLGAVFSQFSDQSIVRRELFRIASALKAHGRHRGAHRRAHRGLRPDRALRRRGVHRRQRDDPAQRARGREAAGARSRS